MLLNDSAAFIIPYHGPTHPLRCAIVPICRKRQSRAALGPFCSKAFNPFATDAFVAAAAGLKMNARSLDEPSPLMSPATVGVNVKPDVALSADDTPNEPPKKMRAYCTVT